tara:strand:+ start:220 stop:507 length:288 start_codon:yes stop_codon:yes gene_type:complete
MIYGRNGEHLDDDVGLGLLGLDVRGKVGLAVVDRLLHLLHRGAALSNVTLRLPRELDVVGDVEVDGEVERLEKAASSIKCADSKSKVKKRIGSDV